MDLAGGLGGDPVALQDIVGLGADGIDAATRQDDDDQHQHDQNGITGIDAHADADIPEAHNFPIRNS